MGDTQKLSETRIERNLLIPLSDGVSLAADLCCPAGQGPFPALVSYYPYHKDDLIGAMHEHPRGYLAARGYANLLVDFRGLGGSEGVVWEAMDRAEGRDGAEVIEWAARQPWCDGNVGMWGISYGAITSLKTAAENPPHLKAIAPIQGTTDIYFDYLYPGGCLNCLGAFGAWGSFMLAMNLMPPTFVDPEGRWYRVWQERLENSRPYILPWQEHPEHDEYWSSRVVEASRLKVPAFIIGGWRDIFPDAMPRVFAELRAPKKLLMGPWMHTLADLSPFEPLDYLYDLVRWFDYWLKGEKNGILDEPAVTLCVQGANTWRHEREWPPARAQMRTLFLSAGRVLADAAPDAEGSEDHRATPTTGMMAGLWDPTGLGVGSPLDQGQDDLMSLAFTSAPLAEDTEITGSPGATLNVALESGDEVNLVAKLCDVGPDGRSVLITSGWLNGSHRASHTRPEPLKRGEVNEFRLPLWATSYLVPAGHRIRLSISCSDFPRLFPTRINPAVRLFFGGRRASCVRIPVVAAAKTPLAAPQIRRPDPRLNRMPWTVAMVPRWKIEHDLTAGRASVTTGSRQVFNLPDGGTFEMDHVAKASVAAARPDGASVEGDTTIRLHLPAAGEFEIATSSRISQSGLSLSGRVTVDGRVFFDKRWQK